MQRAIKLIWVLKRAVLIACFQVHLVIWTKFELEDDPATDDLTPEARAELDQYVDKTFCSKLGKENVSSPKFDKTSRQKYMLIVSRSYGSKTGSR